jgi:hypothetical protein
VGLRGVVFWVGYLVVVDLVVVGLLCWFGWCGNLNAVIL